MTERSNTPRGDEWWAEMDKIDAVSVYGGRVTPYDGVYHVYLAETNCSLWRFKTYEEARDKLLWALNKGGYCDEDNPLKELERLRAMQSETGALAPASAYVLAIQQSVGSILSQYSANKILDRAKEIANGH